MYEIKRGGHADMKRIYPMLEHDFHEWERPSLADCHLGLIRGAELLLLKDESGLEAGYAYMLRDAARRYALLGWLAVYPTIRGGGTGAQDYGSVENLLIALVVLVVILICKHCSKGMLSYSCILIGIIVGYVICAVLPFFLDTTGVTADGVEYTKAWVLNWDQVREASWFAVPEIMPVKPVFDMRAILPVMIMFIVTAVETVGDISGVMLGGIGREATDKELSGGIMCDGLGSSFAALFGVLPNTSFSQNVGLVTMTKIVNRVAFTCGAVFLILCGLMPKLAALVSIMPQSVLGGAAVMMFSSIVMSGIQLVTKEPLTARNMTIVSVALGLGYGLGANSAVLSGLPQAIQLIFGGSGIVPAALVAIVLNVLLPKEKAEENA